QVFKNAAALLIILELIETRASRREQHNVARLCSVLCDLNSPVERSCSLQQRHAFEVRRNLFGGRANQQDISSTRCERFAQRRVRAALVLTSENDDQPPFFAAWLRLWKRLDRFECRVHVCRL